MKREELQKLFNEIEGGINANSSDFVDAYYNSNCYISDAFHEFADNNTSVYYCDQRKYFNENSEACENALLELYDAEFIDDKIKKEGIDSLLCFAGCVGEYEAIYNELSDDEENIKKLILIKLAIENDIIISDDDINNIEYENIDRIDGIKDYLEGLQDEEK